MRNKFIAFALGVFLMMPCALCAAEVYIGIKDMHCGDDRPISSASRAIHNNLPLIPRSINTISDGAVQKVFQNGHIYIKRGENVYNMSGMRIK